MYERFAPTADRDYTLIVSDGCAYRDSLPGEYDPKAMDLLRAARETISDKHCWIPTVHEPGYASRMILAVDRRGDGVNPCSSIAVRWTLLGSIDRAYQEHYSPDALRISMNAMQMSIDGLSDSGTIKHRTALTSSGEPYAGSMTTATTKWRAMAIVAASTLLPMRLKIWKR